uniref:ATP synthase complex subunit 8 n=1 Tax=Phloiophilus edwardsi TaxID=295730 RepID=A0A0S2MR13_9CUCU|nr:ATP synthase F0 subunit 8 [Phloiophilus edwardsi]
MPQMMPLNWLMLFIMFTLTFLLLNSMNYYMFNYINKNTDNYKLTIKNNWKW